MKTKPWSMIWTTLDHVTKIMKTVMVVQSKRDARVKRSHANRREVERKLGAARLRVPARWWAPKVEETPKMREKRIKKNGGE